MYIVYTFVFMSNKSVSYLILHENISLVFLFNDGGHYYKFFAKYQLKQYIYISYFLCYYCNK